MGQTGSIALFLTFLIARGLAVPVSGQENQSNPTPASQVAAREPMKVEDRTRELGPFQLNEQRFSVVLHEKHLADSASTDPDMVTTLAAMEIRDAEGTVHFRETYPYEVSGGEFSESLAATAELLQGKERTGLLITYGTLPSTPLGGQSWQVFGLFDKKLVPFSKQIYAEGELVEESDGSVMRTVPSPGLQGEVLNFRVWTGNFFVIYPVKIDFLMAKALPAWRCYNLTPQGAQAACQYRVETDRVPPEEDMTFVRLHVEANEGMGNAEHVVLKQDSKVEFLAAEGDVEWQEDENGVSLNPGGDFWIKVRIDNKEGWIHTQEDFEAIGLPQTG